MPDVLIRGLPQEVLAALDAAAARLGLSRSEFLRRQVLRVAAAAHAPVSAEDLRTFATRFSDLADPQVMRDAWS